MKNRTGNKGTIGGYWTGKQGNKRKWKQMERHKQQREGEKKNWKESGKRNRQIWVGTVKRKQDEKGEWERD